MQVLKLDNTLLKKQYKHSEYTMRQKSVYVVIVVFVTFTFKL